MPIHKLNKGLMAGVKLDVFFPGFPTLKHIRHTTRLVKTGVRVFEQTSRGESMMLALQEHGVEVGEVMILVHALPMSGRKFVMGADKSRITLEKQWHNISKPYALQAIVKDILVEDK